MLDSLLSLVLQYTTPWAKRVGPPVVSGTEAENQAFRVCSVGRVMGVSKSAQGAVTIPSTQGLKRKFISEPSHLLGNILSFSGT